MKLYAERDIENLDTYFDHVMAMTGEALYSKSAIAAELAFRDNRIAELTANQAECLEMLDNFHKNTGSLGAKSLVDKILKQASDL